MRLKLNNIQNKLHNDLALIYLITNIRIIAIYNCGQNISTATEQNKKKKITDFIFSTLKKKYVDLLCKSNINKRLTKKICILFIFHEKVFQTKLLFKFWK